MKLLTLTLAIILSLSLILWAYPSVQARDNSSDNATVGLEVEVVPPPTPAGAGGGGMPTYYLNTDLFGVVNRYRISYYGVLLETVEDTSEFGMLTIIIPEGVIALDKDGNRLRILKIRIDESPPSPPEDAHIIGLIYDFDPEGATFNPPFELLINYDPEELPENVSSVFIAYYDEEQGWTRLETISGFVAAVGTATAEVSHLTTFAIIGTVTPPIPTLPAAFTVGSLSVSPLEVNVGETVTISLLVTNFGGMSGSYTVTLKINGVKEAEKSVTVATGGSQTVTFSVTGKETGSYTVLINGLSASFTVLSPGKVAEIEPPEEEGEVAEVPAKPFNWPLVVWIIVMLVAVGLLIFFWMRRRRKVA